MRNSRYRTKVWILLCTLLCSGAVWAEEEMDPPDRVARLSFVNGTVSLAPADSDDWSDALLNRPVTTGDRLWVDAGGRAEVQIGTSTLHLDENTGLAFLTLDDDTLLLRLTDGGIAVHVHTLETNESVQIETPNAIVVLRQPGEYSIDTEDDGDRTIVKTRSGEAEVTGVDSNQHGYIVDANEQGIFTGSDELSSVMTQAGRRSTFETWAYEREARANQSVAANYVPAGVVGYQDLDSYGTWSNDVEYGNVWQPSASYVFTDWAPYRYGRWLWVQPWGWTWIDDAPWGYAPFHYGRWTYLRQRWCWVPGPRHVRASYAPALVAWVGPPSFGVDFRQVGWFPLGPREIYIPGRRSSWRYFHNVNAWNSPDNTELSNAYNGHNQHYNYRNRGAPHAVTVVDHDAFVSARRTHGQRVDVDADDLKHRQNQGRVPSIDPNNDSRFGARPTGRVPAPHLDRQAVATRYQPVTRQRVLPSQPDDSSAQDAAPQGNSPRVPSERSGTTRQWSGNNVGDRPSRLNRPPNPQSNGGEAFDDAAPADVPDSNDDRGPPGAVTMLPDSSANRPAFHRDTPPQADRPARNSYPPNAHVPAPVATPHPAPPQMSDRPDQPPQNQRQERHDRPTQKQERQARLETPQQQAHRDNGGQVAPQPVQVAPQAQVAPQQVVQQPRSAPAPQGDANNRAMAPPQPQQQQQPQQQHQRAGRTAPQPQQPRDATNGTGPGGDGTTRGSMQWR